MTRIKICGVTDAAAFDAVVEIGADYVGFNFFPPSPRYVTPSNVASLSARHEGGPRRVGLFVDPSEADIDAALAAIRLDILQLYVAPARAAELRARFAIPVWRAVGVLGAADLPTEMAGADALLVETKAPADATRPGGNARTFDWGVLSGWTPPGPWMLAGGLDPDNVTAAIRATGAPVVDVSSGVERGKGHKDPGLIRAFAAAVRAG